MVIAWSTVNTRCVLFTQAWTRRPLAGQLPESQLVASKVQPARTCELESSQTRVTGAAAAAAAAAGPVDADTVASAAAALAASGELDGTAPRWTCGVWHDGRGLHPSTSQLNLSRFWHSKHPLNA